MSWSTLATGEVRHLSRLRHSGVFRASQRHRPKITSIDFEDWPFTAHGCRGRRASLNFCPSNLGKLPTNSRF